MIDDGKYSPPSRSYIRKAYDIGFAHGLAGGGVIPEVIRKNAMCLSAYETGYSAAEQKRLLENAARKVTR